MAEIEAPIKDHEFLENAVELEFTSLTPEELETEKRLRRMIDLRIMPLAILVYTMNYMLVPRTPESWSRALIAYV
jgi:hypothetical protein